MTSIETHSEHYVCPYCGIGTWYYKEMKKHLSKHLVKPSIVVWLLLVMFLFGVYCEYMILTY
jgi:hypothetical protein